MTDIQAYQISVPDSELDKLSKKLALSTFPDEELDEAGWTLGAPLAEVKKLATYWKDTFSWRDAEAKMNQLPNYRTKITVEGFSPIDIHFVHQKSEVQGAIPLLFCHGCSRNRPP